MMKLDKFRSNAEDFNALHDLEGIFQQNLMSDGRISRRNGKISAIHKKMDFKPKYDPGWKFIGLGKRPRQSEMYGYENRYNSFVPNDSEYYDDAKVKNPLVAMSTLMNFEVLNAIRLGIAEAAAKDIKKVSMKQSQHFPGNSAENNRFSGRSLYMGKQNVMYDPAWMLTTLGK
ncbi:hypothetical protein JTE90_015881 [Oedothorax gibbosus]|uniref:Uncharacterized protein n=1 Tax=Oedothorax gibbosus TaxID=931172 RepID=A0AAV6VVR5_9ARAC|nr:hypothetical protein JTE90_015881 [Oedothorax gibbosus]